MILSCPFSNSSSNHYIEGILYADDICHGCQIDEYSENSDPDWERKYIYMRWKDAPAPETENDL